MRLLSSYEVAMMKLLKFLIPALVLLALAVGFHCPQGKAGVGSDRPASFWTVASDDDPWDPGDERDPHPKPPSKKHISMGSSQVLLAGKGDDKPWDPGDESHKRKGARNA
jgi:hypothetical protein